MKKYRIFTLIFLSFIASNAQHKIEPIEGYTPHIGIMVNMLEDLKMRITDMVKDLSLEQTDYLIYEDANSIGQLLLHVASTEYYYMVETLEGRPWTEEEQEKWMPGAGLIKDSDVEMKGKPITYYLEMWDEVRKKTLEGLKQKDDEWFASELDETMNYHWVWYHVMEHSANHMGQIAHVQNKMPKTP